MDPRSSFHSSPRKKPVQSKAQDCDFYSQSVDGIYTASSSNTETFPSLAQSNFIGLTNSGDLEFLTEGGTRDYSRMAKTQSGSKKLQQMISKSRPEEIEKIVETVAEFMGELMIDKYGNYMCQTLVQSCSAAQRLKLLQGMRGNLIRIACDVRGTHALQNLIALSNLNEEEMIYQQCFAGAVVRLSKDLNASHVIQRLLVTVKNSYFIVKEILGHVKELAMDKLGLCVIKKCVKNPQVFNEILENCLILMQDPYGNYAVQVILEIWREECAFEFIGAIQGKAAQLCIQKYASNVIEKAMKVEVIRKSILNELIREDKLDLLIASPYGCFVLRTAISDCDRNEKREMKRAFEILAGKIHSSKLQTQWEEFMSSFGNI